MGYAHRAMGRMFQRMAQDGLFDLGGDPVRVRVPRPLHLVAEAGGTVGLVVAADLVELLPAVADSLQALLTLPRSCASSSRLSLRRAIL